MTDIPYNKETEQATIGSIFCDGDSIHRIRGILPKAEMFHLPQHQWIYQAMLDLSDENVPPDFLTVMDLLEQRGKLKEAGGAAYITLLLNAVPTSLHAEHYAETVERDYVRRSALTFAGQVAQWAHKAEDADELLAHINKGVIDLEKRSTKGEPVSVASVADDLCEQVQEWKDDPLPPNAVRGISTGMLEFDKMMGGMERGESMVIICAVTGAGKTAFALTSAYRMAKLGYKVLFFALEMKKETLTARLASAESGVSYKKIKRGVKENSDWYASPEEYAKFVAALADVKEAPNLYIDDTQDLTLGQIRARSMALAHKIGGIDLLVGDTGNLMQGGTEQGKNFAQTESDKVKGVRNLIKELDCVGYLTWQLLSKRVEMRVASSFGRMPTLADVRDTGGVAEHASDVIGLYRDEMYNDKTQYKNIMHQIGLKRRNDAGNTRELIGFDAAYQKFFSPEIHRKEIRF